MSGYTRGDSSTAGSQKDAGEQSETADKGRKDKQGNQWFVGSNQLSYRREKMEMRTAFADGLISDWDVYEKLLDHALRDSLNADPSEHPILMAEPSYNTPAIREKLTEILFET